LVELIRPVDLPIRRGDRYVSFAITQKLKRLVEGSLGRVVREARNPERGALFTVKIMGCVLWHADCESRC
jgi:hypothetical protein